MSLLIWKPFLFTDNFFYSWKINLKYKYSDLKIVFKVIEALVLWTKKTCSDEKKSTKLQI
jgi:hypothetical protein